MDLFYCKGSVLNFGDDMNEWFWDEIFPDFRDFAPDHTMFGIGSILWRDNVAPFKKIVVMGSGAGVGALPDFPDDTLFQFVRGPRTAKLFGLSDDQFITDPACCAPTLPGMEPPERPHGDAILVPHAGTVSLPVNWDAIANALDMRLVSPSAESRSVIRDIAGARLVLAESMHAAILADAYRVPWIPVAIRPNVWNFKWLDWADSMQVDMQMHSALDRFKRVYGFAKMVRGELRGLRNRLRPAPAAEELRFVSGEALGKTQEFTLAPSEKDMLRGVFARHSGIIERLLISDLRRLARSTPYMSSDARLAERQSRIAERIDQTRTLLQK